MTYFLLTLIVFTNLLISAYLYGITQGFIPVNLSTTIHYTDL